MPVVANVQPGFKAQKAELVASMAVGGASIRGVRKSLQQLTQLADQSLASLWQRAGLDRNGPYAALALVAVGGFGRGELFPHSDVDVLLLLPNTVHLEQEADLRARIESFIGSCWDAGLDIGSSVRTLDECLGEAARDVTVQTSLLESRWLACALCRFRQVSQLAIRGPLGSEDVRSRTLGAGVSQPGLPERTARR